MLLAEPAHHPPPGVVGEVAEGPLGGGEPEVVGHAPKDPVDGQQKLPQGQVVGPRAGQCLHLPLGRRKGVLGHEGVGERAPPSLPPSLDAKAQEVEGPVHVGDERLVRREPKPEAVQKLGGLISQRLCLLTGAGHQDHEIVRVPDESSDGPALRAKVAALSLPSRRFRPRGLEGLVEGSERQVGEQGGDDPTLRGAGGPSLQPPQLCQHARLEERLDERQDPAIGDAPSDPLDHQPMRDGVEAGLQITLDHPVVAVVDEVHHLGDGVLRPASGPVGVARPVLVGLEDRLQHELERHLHDPVPEGRDGGFILPLLWLTAGFGIASWA
jgi:hypothetical protein